ncbi:hypothetical protein ACFOW1_02810 [Parasediminibacterium paludis]|uniref:Uncharacterized protein n=1 Tax=Parasediminibacterium paludis TaxID=908966 RepID=A0ABV8PU91_9BACT
MLRRILACILFGLGLLIVTFFRKYSGQVIPYPFLFYLAGLAMFMIAALLLRNVPTRIQLTLQKQIADLKENGNKIRVDFSQCEIKENNYTEEQDKFETPNELFSFGYGQEIQVLDAFTKPSHNVEQIQINQSIIFFNYQNNQTGQEEIFVSRVINKDRVTLMFHLEQQKSTTLFVDKINRKKYYFDLAFLNN